jgi:uncharacterized protein YlaI
MDLEAALLPQEATQTTTCCGKGTEGIYQWCMCPGAFYHADCFLDRRLDDIDDDCFEGNYLKESGCAVWTCPRCHFDYRLKGPVAFSIREQDQAYDDFSKSVVGWILLVSFFCCLFNIPFMMLIFGGEEALDFFMNAIIFSWGLLPVLAAIPVVAIQQRPAGCCKRGFVWGNRTVVYSLLKRRPLVPITQT